MSEWKFKTIKVSASESSLNSMWQDFDKKYQSWELITMDQQEDTKISFWYNWDRDRGYYKNRKIENLSNVSNQNIFKNAIQLFNDGIQTDAIWTEKTHFLVSYKYILKEGEFENSSTVKLI